MEKERLIPAEKKMPAWQKSFNTRIVVDLNQFVAGQHQPISL
jgi:hypothetical protein